MRPTAALAPALTLALVLACSLLAAGCEHRDPDLLSGYAEADYVRLSSPIGGTLARLHVRRGQALDRDAPVFALEQDSERAARSEAQARVQRAEAALANLKKGRRPDEIAALEAQVGEAEAAMKLSSANLAREQQLVTQKFVAPARLDEAKSALERDRARVREAQAQLRSARLGARPDEIRAAEQEVAAARAQLEQAEWKIGQKTLKSPVAAAVVDVLYREGEYVQPGAPVVTLLAPQHVKARFFVPQQALGRLRLGQQVTLGCDGCGAPIAATVSYIAPNAEYTSPLIYSKENRSGLVFMIEAIPVDAARGKTVLHPGQPLDVRLPAARAQEAGT